MPDPGLKRNILQVNAILRHILQLFPGNQIHFNEKTMDKLEQEENKETKYSMNLFYTLLKQTQESYQY